MLVKLNYTVPDELLQAAKDLLPIDQFRETINQPTGRFFYDPWKIKPEYQGTAWDRILQTLPLEIGEARIISLKPATCYQSHADIDDRYHLNIASHYAYLANLDEGVMHRLHPDGCWYVLDTGPRHSAVNFGVTDRVQLVIRKLLVNANLIDPINVKISAPTLDKDTLRFLFDDIISPWLNKINKENKLADFKFSSTWASFKINKSELDAFTKILPTEFRLEII